MAEPWPGLPPRPALPPHLLAQLPNHQVRTPPTREQIEQIIDKLIELVLPQLGVIVKTDKDPQGWTIRIDLP